MRSLLLLVLGIAFGAAVAALVLNALGRRDAYARGVMQVLQHETGGAHRLRSMHAAAPTRHGRKC